MKNFLILIIAIFFATTIASAKTYTIGKDISELQVVKGDKIIIELVENPTTGYIWKLNATPETVLIEQDKKFVTTKSNLEGVPGLLRYTYKAISSGSAKVEGIYGRPWEKTAKAASNYLLNVTVK